MAPKIFLSFFVLFGVRTANAFSQRCFDLGNKVFSHGFKYPNGRTRAIQEFCTDVITEKIEQEATRYSEFAKATVDLWPSVINLEQSIATIAEKAIKRVRMHRASGLRCYLKEASTQCQQFISELFVLMEQNSLLTEKLFALSNQLSPPVRYFYLGSDLPTSPPENVKSPHAESLQAAMKLSARLLAFIKAEQAAQP